MNGTITTGTHGASNATPPFRGYQTVKENPEPKAYLSCLGSLYDVVVSE